MRISRRIYIRKGLKLDFTAESFNLFNRLNRRFQLTDDGIMSNAAQFNTELNTLESITFQLITGADEFHEGDEGVRSATDPVRCENVILRYSLHPKTAKSGAPKNRE